MKLHPRYFKVAGIDTESNMAIMDVIKRHQDLTYLELLRILNGITASYIKYALREERHPGEDKKADEE